MATHILGAPTWLFKFDLMALDSYSWVCCGKARDLCLGKKPRSNWEHRTWFLLLLSHRSRGTQWSAIRSCTLGTRLDGTRRICRSLAGGTETSTFLLGCRWSWCVWCCVRLVRCSQLVPKASLWRLQTCLMCTTAQLCFSTQTQDLPQTPYSRRKDNSTWAPQTQVSHRSTYSHQMSSPIKRDCRYWQDGSILGSSVFTSSVMSRCRAEDTFQVCTVSCGRADRSLPQFSILQTYQLLS